MISYTSINLTNTIVKYMLLTVITHDAFLYIVPNRDYMKVGAQIFPFQEQGYQNGLTIVLWDHPCLSGFVRNFQGWL